MKVCRLWIPIKAVCVKTYLKLNLSISVKKRFFENILELVKQKGVYLYECMDNFENFEECLSKESNLYSSLSDKYISYKDCKQILKNLEVFEKNMKESLTEVRF